ncbi:unnamed protein product [Cuscuta campestris]|uniref:Uncharacterized protein n=1 Tax=Cuscuta campestris TaxID=132261 RepID=A0A484KTR8_9ASTE|nr:unnamed protein product [Cuscuta campestris]
MEMLRERFAAYYKSPGEDEPKENEPKGDEPKEDELKEDEPKGDEPKEDDRKEEKQKEDEDDDYTQRDATKTSRGVFLSSYVGVIFQLCVSLCALVYLVTLTEKLMMTIYTKLYPMTICMCVVCVLFAICLW